MTRATINFRLTDTRGRVVGTYPVVESDSRPHMMREAFLAYLASGLAPTSLQLAEIDLTGLHFNGLNFRGSNLAGATLDGARILNSDLSGAYMPRASFKGLMMANSMLEKANLIGADFTEANLVRTNLNQADMTGSFMNDAMFTNCGFLATRMNKAEIIRGTFRQCGLRGTAFRESHLSESRFLECHFLSNLMDGADINRIDFTGSVLDGVRFGNARIEHMSFAGAILKNLLLPADSIMTDGISIRQFQLRMNQLGNFELGLTVEPLDKGCSVIDLDHMHFNGQLYGSVHESEEEAVTSAMQAAKSGLTFVTQRRFGSQIAILYLDPADIPEKNEIKPLPQCLLDKKAAPATAPAAAMTM
jgi:Uncharacterized low-complexity proteins